jgi:release factor glutamine methyltransferase
LPGGALDCSIDVLEPELDASKAFDEFLEEVTQFWVPLPDKPEETAERVLCALWRTACGVPASADRALRSSLPPLDGACAERLRGLLIQRRAGVPLAHLTGRQGFLGLEFLASPEALIPRKETEILGRAALAKLTCLEQAGRALTVIDICTGSGNLALAYAYYVPSARVFASDLCQEAVDLAQRNLEHFPERLGLRERVEMRQGDLLEPFDRPEFHGKCDLLSCNPPYISAAKVKQMHPEIANFEPEAAFNGGIYGVSVLMKLIKQAPVFLKPGGWLGFEVGSGQGALMARQLEKHPSYSAVETYKDSGGEIRALFARSGVAGA